MSNPAPQTDSRSSDTALIELLRVETRLGIGQMAASLGVTATAIRQRLDRLMRAGLVCRETLAPPGTSAARDVPPMSTASRKRDNEPAVTTFAISRSCSGGRFAACVIRPCGKG